MPVLLWGIFIGSIIQGLWALAFSTSADTFSANLQTLFSGGSLHDWVLASLTAVLAYFTYRLVTEERKTRHFNTRPYIVISLEYSEKYGEFMLVISNVGKGAAFDITFEVDDDFTYIPSYQAEEITLNNASFKTLPVIRPGHDFKTRLGSIKHFSKYDLKFEVSFRRRTASTKREKFTMEYNLEHMQDWSIPSEFDPKEISDPLKKIAGSVERIANNSRNL